MTNWPLTWPSVWLDPHQRFRKLSTGYRTIAKLIIALCVPCEFVMLDEPVLGLDANNREIFYQELANTFASKPRTFIIASHLIEEIENLVTHVFVLDGGTITLDEDVADLTAKGRVLRVRRHWFTSGSAAPARCAKWRWAAC